MLIISFGCAARSDEWLSAARSPFIVDQVIEVFLGNILFTTSLQTYIKPNQLLNISLIVSDILKVDFSRKGFRGKVDENRKKQPF